MSRYKNQSGFAVTEVLVVVLVLILIVGISFFVFSRASSQDDISADAETSENLEKVRQKLSVFVTANKAIPVELEEEYGVTYSRKDNQTAELCASFRTVRDGEDDNTISPVDIYKGYFGVATNSVDVYRDDVDFYGHTKGRNCYVINYAPINVAYEEQYKNDSKNHQFCDAYRQYDGKFTSQTIQGFVIGGPFTSNPGTAGGRAVLGRDVDAYDEACVKIPISDLGVGDKVEFGFEKGPVNDGEITYFVKAIKKVH